MTIKSLSGTLALTIAILCSSLTFAVYATTAGGSDVGTTTRKAERKYKCTKCRQVFTFDGPGNYKCPNCGKPLIPANN